MAEHDDSPRRTQLIWYAAIAGVVAAAVVVLAVGLAGRDDGSITRPAAAPAQATGIPEQIQANLRDGNRVVDGRITDRLTRLKGVPVVVNMWASWCPNCRAEFPFFQQLSDKYKRRVAFVGLDSQDDRADAEVFLKQYPVNYPSVFDQSAAQAVELGAGRGWPTTL